MHDVAVVGCGPVGCLVALLAARRGLRVLVLERRTTVSPRPRGIAVHPPAGRVLQAAGVGFEAAVRIHHGTARDRGQVLGALEFSDPVLSLPQQRIEHALRALLAEEPNATLRTGVVARIVCTADSGDPELEAAGGRIRAGAVIAADGVGSTVRAAAGVGWRRVGRGIRYLMADVPDDTDLGNEAVLWFATDGVVESFPTPGSRRRWVARTRAGTDLTALIRRRVGVAVPIRLDAVSAFIARQHQAAPCASSRLVLLGDAAHEISPIGGQGMSLSLLDTAALIGPLERALSGDADALPAWDARRRPLARRTMAQARFNMAVGMPLPDALQPLRRGAIRTLALWRGPLAARFTMARL